MRSTIITVSDFIIANQFRANSTVAVMLVTNCIVAIKASFNFISSSYINIFFTNDANFFSRRHPSLLPHSLTS
ncbi:protein of unknown function [Candidatus Nitrosocosmicus franklandus]|uniref:Uncharacterized protein n=1 Tax=Candidatus Nitrosocosmicus franklandianus TaxID=1798806 RepID=A0A484I6N4_9ARCH|nr:protein of unknown function [Candidatus Nitrosocosmicus franklandus]